MRAILPEFLRVVDPRQSGFLDVLYANEVITESDNSSLSGKDVLTRKDQVKQIKCSFEAEELEISLSDYI